MSKQTATLDALIAHAPAVLRRDIRGFDTLGAAAATGEVVGGGL